MLSPHKTRSPCLDAACPSFLYGKMYLQNKASGELMESIA